MKKVYTDRYPGKEWRSDLGVVLMGMLSARRYLASHGFVESTNDERYVSGTFHFPDGSFLDALAFRDSSDPDSLLEKIVKEHAEFRRHLVLSGYYHRKRVITSEFRKSHYLVGLRVTDTTRERVRFPFNQFLIKPRDFALCYDIRLDKDIILKEDIEVFDRYVAELERAVVDLTHVHQRVPPQPQGASRPPLKPAEMVDPWKVDIPNVGEKHE